MSTMTLILDDLDYATIQTEIAERQKVAREHGFSTLDHMPVGDSNIAGAVLAECIRDLNEYRDLWDAEHPPEPTPEETQP